MHLSTPDGGHTLSGRDHGDRGVASVSRRSVRIGLAAVTLAAALFAMSAPGTGATAPNGGIFRVYI